MGVPHERLLLRINFEVQHDLVLATALLGVPQLSLVLMVAGYRHDLAVSGGSSSRCRPHQAQAPSHARYGMLGGFSRPIRSRSCGSSEGYSSITGHGCHVTA